MRTLIVEDTLINQEFLRMIMEQWGECLVVDNGEEAVAAFDKALETEAPFDLIFMDIMLPGMNGLQALEQIRATEEAREVPDARQVKVIVTTALDDDANASRAFMQGQALSYITKPIRQEKIETELRKFGMIE